MLKRIEKQLLVIGSIALDITATTSKTASATSLRDILHTSTPGHIKQTLGGVGRNVAESAWRSGAQQVKLVSAVGQDLAGQVVKAGMDKLGMSTQYIETLESQQTAVYNALHSNDGQLVAAVADMGIFDAIKPEKIASIIRLEKPSFVCFDGNITAHTMRTIVHQCHQLGVPALFEPTSVPKSLKILENLCKDRMYQQVLLNTVRYTTPNQFEVEAMYETMMQTMAKGEYQYLQSTIALPTSLKAPATALKVYPYASFLTNLIPNVVTKLGEEGCLFVSPTKVHYFPPEVIQHSEIESVTGAGDCFVGTLLANLQAHNSSYQKQNIPSDEVLHKIIHNCQRAAIRTLKSEAAVSSEINKDLLV